MGEDALPGTALNLRYVCEYQCGTTGQRSVKYIMNRSHVGTRGLNSAKTYNRGDLHLRLPPLVAPTIRHSVPPPSRCQRRTPTGGRRDSGRDASAAGSEEASPEDYIWRLASFGPGEHEAEESAQNLHVYGR